MHVMAKQVDFAWYVLFNTLRLTSASLCFLQPSDPPVVFVDVVLLLLLAATPFALVRQWCSSAGRLSDPAVSLDAPRGSLGGRETAQTRILFCVNPAGRARSRLREKKRQNGSFITFSSSCYMILMSCCASTKSCLTKMMKFCFLFAVMDECILQRERQNGEETEKE